MTGDCPQQVPWCEQHEVLDVVDEVGDSIERHIAWLYTRYAPAVPAMPATALYVSDSTHLSTGPALALRQYDNPPQATSPEDARSLAAALVRGAELVEASRTATCPTCGLPASPEDLAYPADPATDDEGDCGRCRSRRWTEHVDRRRAMKVVR